MLDGQDNKRSFVLNLNPDCFLLKYFDIFEFRSKEEFWIVHMLILVEYKFIVSIMLVSIDN